MRIVFRYGTGAAPGSEHLEPGEAVWDDTSRRLGIGDGSTTPRWYPAIGASGDLLLNSAQAVGSLDKPGIMEVTTDGVKLRYVADTILDTHGVVNGVNSLSITNAATTATPVLAAEGADTNVSLELRTKGTGSVNVRTGGGVQFAVSDVVSAVNYPTLSGGATGTPAVVGAAGANASVDLLLAPKGAGLVRFGGYTGAVSAIAGYIQIKDSGGTVRKLAILA